MIDISVIIVNYRGWKDLENCLCAFQSFKYDHYSFEVIIVDNCSNDGFFSDFQVRFKDFTFVLNTGNNGFSNGCNLGATLSHGTYLLFLNSDIIPTDVAIAGMLESLRTNPEIMILSCKQLNRKNKEEQTLRFFPSYLTLNGLLRAIYRNMKLKKMPVNVSAENGIVYSDWVSGSVVLISKSDFDGLGGWDDSYWLYYEDVDLCLRAHLSGRKVAIDKHVSMIHNHGGATRINLQTTALTKSEVIISLHVYLAKHYSRVQAIGLHMMVIFDALVVKLIPALLGVPFFFIRRFSVYRQLYFSLIVYYFRVIFRGSWLSTRSVKYKI